MHKEGAPPMCLIDCTSFYLSESETRRKKRMEFDWELEPYPEAKDLAVLPIFTFFFYTARLFLDSLIFELQMLLELLTSKRDIDFSRDDEDVNLAVHIRRIDHEGVSVDRSG